MRFDGFLVDHPAQQVGSTVSHVADHALGFQIELLLHTPDHGPGRVDFGGPPGWRRLDIDNDSHLHINQIVGRIGVKRRATYCRPTRGGISRRDRRGNGGRLNLRIECRQILAYGPCRVPWIAQILHLLTRHTTTAIGIGLDHTGIDGKAFATDQPFLHTPLNDALEHMSKRVALTKATVAVLRERRMVRHCIPETQSTEPAIGQIEVDLFAQPALGTNAKAVPHDQHPHHQLRIDRRPPSVAVERRKMTTQLAEVENSINTAQQVISRNVIVEIERVEQLPLPARSLPHHRRRSLSHALPSSIATKRALSREFFNGIGRSRPVERKDDLTLSARSNLGYYRRTMTVAER